MSSSAGDLSSAPVGRRRIELGVRAAPASLPWVRRALEDLGLPDPVQDDARLLVNELVTNSIRHSGLGPEDRVRIRAEWSGSKLRVDVYDGNRGPWVAGAIRPPPGADSGWGLYLVDRLASRWGRGRGRHWFELDLDP